MSKKLSLYILLFSVKNFSMEENDKRSINNEKETNYTEMEIINHLKSEIHNKDDYINYISENFDFYVSKNIEQSEELLKKITKLIKDNIQLIEDNSILKNDNKIFSGHYQVIEKENEKLKERIEFLENQNMKINKKQKITKKNESTRMKLRDKTRQDYNKK